MNWDTSELQINLYDKQSHRVASIILLGGLNNRKYMLTTGISRTPYKQSNQYYHATLAQAKAAGKAWVEQGIKPKEASHE